MNGLQKFSLVRSGGGGPGQATMAFNGANTSGVLGVETHTFTNVDFGPADSSRYIVIAVALTILQLGFGGSVTCTIGGVSATKIVSSDTTAPTDDVQVYLFGASVPTGTTGSVAFATNDTDDFNVIDIASYSLYNVITATRFDTDYKSTLEDGSTLTFTVPTGGVAIAVTNADGDAELVTPSTNMTLDNQTTLHNVSFSTIVATETVLTLTDTADAARHAVGASWSPA